METASQIMPQYPHKPEVALWWSSRQPQHLCSKPDSLGPLQSKNFHRSVPSYDLLEEARNSSASRLISLNSKVAPRQLLPSVGEMSPLHSPPVSTVLHARHFFHCWVSLQRLLELPATTITMTKQPHSPTAPLSQWIWFQVKASPAITFLFIEVFLFTVSVVLNSVVRLFLCPREPLLFFLSSSWWYIPKIRWYLSERLFLCCLPLHHLSRSHEVF